MSYKANRRSPPIAFDPAVGCTHNDKWVKNTVVWVPKYDSDGYQLTDWAGRPDVRPIYKLVFKCEDCGRITTVNG